MKFLPLILVQALVWTMAAAPARADDWGALATISSTLGANAGRLCMAEGSRGDIGCPTYAPSLTTAGHVSVTGNLSASKFFGDGSGLTGVGSGDRIVSTSANVVVGNGGTVSFTTGGVSGTAYIDTSGRFVAAGVSTTGVVSATRLFVSFVSTSSGLTLISGTSSPGGSGYTDRIFGTSSAVLSDSDGSVKFTTGGVSSTAYFDTTGRLVGAGVSTTGPVSATAGYFSGSAEVRGTVSASTVKLAESPANACTAASAGTIKFSNGRPFICRYP